MSDGDGRRIVGFEPEADNLSSYRAYGFLTDIQYSVPELW
jgi:hypothetical protein